MASCKFYRYYKRYRKLASIFRCVDFSRVYPEDKIKHIYERALKECDKCEHKYCKS